MASGWHDLRKELERQAAAHSPDAAALWSTFEELVAASPRAEVLGHARRLGTTLSPKQRVVLAGVIGMLLDPIEWPAEWEQARGPLVQALGDVVRQANPEERDSLAAVLRLEDDRVFNLSRAMLVIARRMLHKPYSKEDLVFVGSLCFMGNTGLLGAAGAKLHALPPDLDRDAVRYLVMNDDEDAHSPLLRALLGRWCGVAPRDEPALPRVSLDEAFDAARACEMARQDIDARKRTEPLRSGSVTWP